MWAMIEKLRMNCWRFSDIFGAVFLAVEG